MKKHVAVLCSVLALSLCVSRAPVAQAAPKGVTLSKDNPIAINYQAKRVSFLAEVNGKYFFQPTRHAAVFKGGKNGDKAVLRALADHKAFYDALITLGFKAGENMTRANKEKTFVKGDSLSVSVTWEGADKVYSLDEVIKDSNGTPMNMRFGGNLSRAIKTNNGCLLCLDSCPVGVVSNASYTYGSVEKRNEVTFTGRKDILPPDGSLVVVTLGIKE